MRSSYAVGSPAREQHDLRAPPQSAAVALGLMRDHARGLQVIEPALHAACGARARTAPAPHRSRGTRAPAHHRRQPDYELLDRGREPRRPRGVTEPEQVALDRVDPRLEPIITRRRRIPAPAAPDPATRTPPADRAPPAAARAPADTNDAGARRRGSGSAFQRHRQRPKTPGARSTQRSRADARGAAGPASSSREHGRTGTRRPHPSRRGWRSVRRTATVGENVICRCSSRSAELA